MSGAAASTPCSATKPVAVAVARSLYIYDSMLEFATQYGVPVLSAAESTSRLMSDIISILGVELAPRVTRHGVLVEVYGEGILLIGESGVGKSENAIELLKRGHRLIARRRGGHHPDLCPQPAGHRARADPLLYGASGHRGD